jgi:hypothetical protein
LSAQRRYAPGFLHLFLGIGAGHRLISGVDIGQNPHVAGALDVVLAAQRVDPAAFDSQVAAEHGEVGEAFDVVGAADVLGDSHAIEDAAGFGAGVHSRRADRSARPGFR